MFTQTDKEVVIRVCSVNGRLEIKGFNDFQVNLLWLNSHTDRPCNGFIFDVTQCSRASLYLPGQL